MNIFLQQNRFLVNKHLIVKNYQLTEILNWSLTL